MSKPTPLTIKKISSIADLDKVIIKCNACERLVSWREEVAQTKRKSYENEKYWGKPVTGFGPGDASMLIVGLAPGAHGANRTGRIFTGDRSGDWLYGSLHRLGLAKFPHSIAIDDGQELKGVRITCAVHCAPPDNKPENDEKKMCSSWLEKEITLMLPTIRTLVALGNFAWSGLLTVLSDLGFEIAKPKPKFSHGGETVVIGPDGIQRLVIGSYHPSQQNTFTGKLTESMLDSVLQRGSRFTQLK